MMGEPPEMVIPGSVKIFPDKVLFYIFYNMHHERVQVDAAKELELRGWWHNESSMLWLKKHGTNTVVFDPINWTELIAH